MKSADIPRTLTAAREAAQLSAYALSRASDTHHSTIQRIEDGEDCSLSTLSRIAAALGLRVALVPVRDGAHD